LKKKGKFFESISAFGHKYAISLESIISSKDNSKIRLFNIDVKGAESFNKYRIQANFVGIMIENIQELKNRLEKRNTEKSEEVTKRINQSEEEIRFIQNSGLFTYILINKDRKDFLFNGIRLASKLYGLEIPE